jgi:Na+-translocating ferredoxin:NAD+ oxidoreductase RnfG subunit
MSAFLGSLGLGFSVSLTCAVTCLPVYLSFGMTGEAGKDWGNVGMLLAGRLLAYLLIGALAGALGSAFSAETVSRVSMIAMIPLCVLLFLRAAGVFTREIRLCGILATVSERVRSPLIVGFLLGFSICYPFLIAIAAAAAAGGAPGGMLVFAGFFVGTSAFLAPLLLLPLVRARAFREWVGRTSPVIAAALALLYLSRALAIVAPATHALAVVTRADVEKLFPEAPEIEYAGDASPRYYRAFSGTGDDRSLAGYAVASAECAPDIMGYGGPIPLLVALDPQGRIVQVSVLPNDETPSYVSRLFSAEVLSSLAGKSYRDAFQVGRDVDAISGATVSQTALTRTLQKTLQVFSTQVLRMAPVAEPEPARVRLADFGIVAFLAAAAASVFVLRFGLRLRRWFLALSVVSLGLVFGFFLSVADIVRILFGVPFAPADFLPRLALVVTALGITVVLGRHYCSLVCPYGALQELVFAASPLKRAVSPGLDRFLRLGKYVVLLALPFLFAFGRDFSVLAFEPFAPTFRAMTSPAFLLSLVRSQLPLFLLLVVVLLANLVSERFYCKYLCPLGAIFSLFSTARIVSRQTFMIPGRTCAGCSKGLESFASECFTCGGQKA